MKATFKIGSKAYAFKDLTLRKYYEIKKILESQDKDKEFSIVSCMTDCPVQDLKRLTFADWLLLWAEAEHKLTNLQGDAGAIRPIIEHEGVKYGLPKIEELTVGEFADLDIIMSAGNAESKMAEIAAVLYRPILTQKGEKITLKPYDTDGFTERVELFQDFPLSAIKSANSFFLQSADLLLKSTADSLLKTQETKLISPKDLDNLRSLLQPDPGGTPSTYWLGKILSDFKQLRSSQYAQHLTGLPGKRTRFVERIWPFKNKQNII
jgi:hypothetical protein